VNCDLLAGDSFNDTPVPVRLPAGAAPEAVSAGTYDGYVLASNATLYGWGVNQSGQLDTGAPTDCITAPGAMPLPSGVTPTSIASNAYDVYSIGSDGNLYAWGDNSIGELGAGLATGPETCGGAASYCSTTPVRVALPQGSIVAVGGTSATEYAIVSSSPSAPHVITQPASQSVAAGQGATFVAAAGGVPAPTVQWEVSTDGGATFAAVPGATSDTLTITDPSVADNGNEYETVFSNGISPDATASAATLSVSPDVAPVVTVNPLDQTSYAGTTVSSTVGASGTPTPSVDWQLSVDGGSSWISLGPLTGDTVTSGTLSAFEDGWEFRAVFTNLAGSATTTAATIHVVPALAPRVTTQPLSASVASGGTAPFVVGASGTPTPSVDWQISVDGGSSWISLGPLTGDTVTSGTLTAFENGWEVRAVLTNGGGSATTTVATVTVT